MTATIYPTLRWVDITHGVETKTIYFDQLDEWSSVTIDGQEIDVHFDYNLRSEFGTKAEWLSYIIQAYSSSDSDYEKQLITKIEVLILVLYKIPLGIEITVSIKSFSIKSRLKLSRLPPEERTPSETNTISFPFSFRD